MTINRCTSCAAIVFAASILVGQHPIGAQSSTQSSAPTMRPVTTDRLENAEAEPENWLMYSGDYKSRRYTQLDQITRENVSDLRVQWVSQLQALDRAETTPLVVDGVMYVTESPSNVIALDAKTGGQYWRYNHELPDDMSSAAVETTEALPFSAIACS